MQQFEITRISHKDKRNLQILIIIFGGNRYDLWIDEEHFCFYFKKEPNLKPLEKLIPKYMNLDDIEITEAREADLRDCKIARLNINDYEKDRKKYFLNHIMYLKNFADVLKTTNFKRRDFDLYYRLRSVRNENYLLDGIRSKKVRPSGQCVTFVAENGNSVMYRF